MSKPARLTFLKIAVALLLLGGAIALNRHEFAKVFRRAPDPTYLLAGFALYWLGSLLGFSRWYIFARMLDLPIKYLEAMKLGFIAHFFNILIPGAVGGDVIRAGYVCREVDRKDRAIASVVLQVLFNLLGLFLLAAIVGIGGWSKLGNVEHRLVGFVVGFLLVGFASLGLWLFPSRKTRGLLVRGERLEESIATSIWPESTGCGWRSPWQWRLSRTPRTSSRSNESRGRSIETCRHWRIIFCLCR